jgi:Putative metallopeptidase
MKLAAGLATLICTVLFAASPAIPQPAKSDRIVIEYVAPTNPAHQPLYDLLKEKQALERVRDLLIGVRWPRTLRLEFEGCDGDANAWYEDAVITVCYEFLDEMWRNANSSRRPSTISREDAFVGPVVNVFLHEASHALFRLLKIPLLGQEEDAADQLAAYLVLHSPKERRRGLILGYAYVFASELKVRRPRDLNRPRLQLGRHVMFADVHDTPAQRLYSLLCLAYGSDKELFADVVEKGFLPKERAEICEDEYRQVDFAYRTLIAPHVDSNR